MLQQFQNLTIEIAETILEVFEKLYQIKLQIHHKDGNRFNHSLENLIILCPNCHSQTENFRFKQGKKNEKSNR